MRKTMMLGALLLAAAAMQAETVILKQAIPQKGVLGGWSVKEIRKSETVTKDKAVCKVIRVDPKLKKQIPNHYQAWCSVKTVLQKGAKYRIRYTLTASADCSVEVIVSMMVSPWTRFSPAKKIMLKKDKPQDVVIDFTPGQDYKGVLRAPGLELGLLKDGQSVAVSNLNFVKLD